MSFALRLILKKTNFMTELRLGHIKRYGLVMDCKEFQEIIPDFLDEKLKRRKTQQFFEHMENCEECSEELKIQYLIKEGIIRLENGDSFDLNKEFKKTIENTKEHMKKQFIINMVIYSLEAVAILAVIFILVLVFTR